MLKNSFSTLTTAIIATLVLNQNSVAQTTTTTTPSTSPTVPANYDYNNAKKELNSVKNAATAQQINQQQSAVIKENASAQLAAETSQDENQKGAGIYQIASAGCELASAAFMAKYAASCSAVKCNDGLLVASVAFGGFAQAASMQADSHSDVAHQSCTTKSRVTAQTTDCGAPPTAFKPGEIITKTFDANGNCIGSPTECENLIKNLPPSTNIKDAMNGLKTFASSSPPFKKNPDGSITTKDGKTYTVENLANENAMIAAGFSPAGAKFASSQLQKMKDSIQNDLNSIALTSKQKKTTNDPYSDSSNGGANKAGSGLLENGAAKNLLGTQDERAIASAEGLVRDFNGESIGISNDDIFKMMNRRYKLKAEQDNFIAP